MPLRPPLPLRQVRWPSPRCSYSPAVAAAAHATRRSFRTSGFFHQEQRQPSSTLSHYERLNVTHDASPADIKKSFYKLSKTHHPDVNKNDPDAAHTFSLLSESYTILSDPPRRAAYDRDVLRLHEHHHHHHAQHQRKGSYHSSSSAQAGGRSPSGLSRRRGTFRGPPPSFYRSGGWGAHAEKRQRAHEESTGTGGSSSSSSSTHENGDRANPWEHRHAGMGPGSDPYSHGYDDHASTAPHFDRAGHERTQQREDQRRWRRARRAMSDDGTEFEPQMSLGAHFLVVTGIIAISFIVPVMYLRWKRAGRRKKELEY